MSNQQKKHNLGIAGEYFVSAELNRRGIHASMTYGNAKKADVVAFSPENNSYVTIEVKTTGQNSWVVGGKMPEKSDLVWFFVLLKDTDPPRYFMLTGEQLNKVLTPQDIAYRKKYSEKHNVEFSGKGVVSLHYSLALPYENNWEIIESRFES